MQTMLTGHVYVVAGLHQPQLAICNRLPDRFEVKFKAHRQSSVLQLQAPTKMRSCGKNNFSLHVAIALKRSEMIALLAVYLPTNF